jgi:chromosome segregation ATPase
MPVNNVPTKAEVEHGDPLTERIRESILGVENLRAENRRLTDQVKALEGDKLQLESELRSVKLALDHERAERRHYHSLANEIITRLDVVGQTIDEVVKRAEQEAYRQRRENPRPDMPEIEPPSFLNKLETLANGYGEKRPSRDSR